MRVNTRWATVAFVPDGVAIFLKKNINTDTSHVWTGFSFISEHITGIILILTTCF